MLLCLLSDHFNLLNLKKVFSPMIQLANSFKQCKENQADYIKDGRENRHYSRDVKKYSFFSSEGKELFSVMFLCCVLVMEQTLGSGVLVQPSVGEARRLSSLTFGCFQNRGKIPQVLTGPEPSQKSIGTLPDRDHTHMDCRRPSTGQKTNIISSVVWPKLIANNLLDLIKMQQGWE